MSILKTIEGWDAKKYFLLPILIAAPVCAWLIFAHAQEQSECPVPLVQSPNVAPFYGEKKCPIVGRMGNVKLAIPQHYILGPVAYKGVDIWNSESYKNQPKHPTLDTEIDNFAIKIRLSNFKPIESRKDVEDYDKLGKANGWKQPPENRWIYVGFKKNPDDGKGSLKDAFDRWIKGELLGSAYVSRPNFAGLQHYLSSEIPSVENSAFAPNHDPRKPFHETTQYEVFFDSDTKRMLIECKHNLIQAPPFDPIMDCTMLFLIPEFGVTADIQSIKFKDDLSRWREIEQGVKQLITSFVVQ